MNICQQSRGSQRQSINARHGADVNELFCTYSRTNSIRTNHRQHLQDLDGKVRRTGQLPIVRSRSISLLGEFSFGVLHIVWRLF